MALNDDGCREELCLIGDTRIAGAEDGHEWDVPMRFLTNAVFIVSDNGTECMSRTIAIRASNIAVAGHYTTPGKAHRNGSLGSLNTSLRNELL